MRRCRVRAAAEQQVLHPAVLGRVLLSFLVVALAALAVACTGAAADRFEVRVGGLVFQAELARTPAEREQGLSGRASLPDDGGMLFVFQEEHRPGFWMRGMRFPLDFIWISRDRRVVDLTENVPPPEPGVPIEELPRYQPDDAVLYVLEVNAGVVREFGIQVGDAVTFAPDIAEEGAAETSGD